MRHETTEKQADSLGPMWEEHREFLRRLLISLTRDIDLADDLLQESYLKARAGFAGYQGGDARAWLAAVVRSSFYSHLRLRYVRSEMPLRDDEVSSGDLHDRLDLIEVRRAIADLPENQRRALVMKHYGGYNYEDIAAHMGCPIGTAKSRVSLALRRLREALAVTGEVAAMKCADLSERKLLDYIYGRFDESTCKQTEEHLAGCPSCRERIDGIRSLLRALDAVEADFKFTVILELNDDGTMTDYHFGAGRNTKSEPLHQFRSEGDTEGTGTVFVNNEEVKADPLPSEPGGPFVYAIELPHPIAPGEPFTLQMVGAAEESPVKHLGGGLHRIDSINLVFSQETVYTMMLRLPSGATFESATPEAQEIRQNRSTSVTWRGVLRADERRYFAADFRM